MLTILIFKKEIRNLKFKILKIKFKICIASVESMYESHVLNEKLSIF